MMYTKNGTKTHVHDFVHDFNAPNGIVWYCKTPMKKAKSLVFCKMAFRGIVLYHGFDFLSLRKTTFIADIIVGFFLLCQNGIRHVNLS